MQIIRNVKPILSNTSLISLEMYGYMCSEERKVFVQGGLKMRENVLSRIMVLEKMPVAELVRKYEDLFDGKRPASTNKTYLKRRIAYRIQELEYGGLSQEAQSKITSLVKEYDPINNKAMRPKKSPVEKQILRDRRLPIPGTVITKEYKGKRIEVKVLDKGFSYQGKIFKTLTTLAKEITGSHWNGFLFFNL